MSMMETMLKDMLTKLIPADVLDLLTAENINKFVSDVKEYLINQELKIDNLQKAVDSQNEKIDNLINLLEKGKENGRSSK